MSQYNWTYVGGGGKNFSVTLFHGKQTGHVLILLNTQVVQIDFGVRESKTYSFFIEDEFCQIRLERKGDEMYYYFEIDKKVDTPRNRARRKLEKKHLFQTLAFFGMLIVLASVASLGFRAYNEKLRKQQMEASSHTQFTVGWVEASPSKLIRYSYVVGNVAYSGSSLLKKVEENEEQPLMPLEDGDEFVVRYDPDHPEFSRLSFTEPTERQQQRYLERALSRHLALHPDAYPPHTRCALECALDRHGAEGLADFFFQDVSPDINPLHNTDSYHRLIRDPAFQQEVERRCWK